MTTNKTNTAVKTQPPHPVCCPGYGNKQRGPEIKDDLDDQACFYSPGPVFKAMALERLKREAGFVCVLNPKKMTDHTFNG